MPDYTAIQSIRNFKGLIRYLRTELEWPVDEDQADDLTFDYEPEELGLDEKHKVKIREIKQIRPLVDGQPWGIFWLDFEPKRLPVVVMRRILGALAASQRRARRNVKQARWDVRDLMFISATGQGSERGLSFAHFRETEDGQPQLRTFAWDVRETHLYYIKNLNLAALRWPADSANAEEWRERWAAAFTAGHRETIRTSEALAGRMAGLADATRHAVNEAFIYEKPGGPLHKLYESFKKVLIHDLSVDDFADMYAQTVTYGLFSARATRSGTFALDVERVVGLIPNTNPFLRDLLAECLKVSAGGYRRAQIDLDELGVGELVQTLQNTDIESVLRDWGRQKRGEDPVIHFYETFLRQYDAEKKAKRGVFYTPDPAVSFIVRSVDYLLRTEFGCKDGLATPIVHSDDFSRQARAAEAATTNFNVQVLDLATGTGTFLKYVIEQIYNTFTQKHKHKSAAERKRLWNEYVPTQLLPRLYGFELMMAPYAVAHMKLGLALKQTEYDFASTERLRVYLTNTLQSVDEMPRVDTPFLAHEAEEANTVKTETPITVIIGNPPYSGHSANKTPWIINLVADYKRGYLDLQKPAQAKWLQDDYVKFIRWAQWRIERTGTGILAMITNHGYLDNPTFRGMRQQLAQTFSEIYVFDLHGSSKKKEKAPDGTKDENVFDIQQGVAICLMLKRATTTNPSSFASVRHSHLYGSRESKYEFLVQADVRHPQWQNVLVTAPEFLFVPQDVDLRAEYEQSYRLPDFMDQNGDPAPGVATQHDDFAVSWTKDEAIEKVKSFLKTSSEKQARELFRLCPQAQWNYTRAKTELASGKWQSAVIPYFYRPMDVRWTIFDSNVAVHRRKRLTQHVFNRDNLVACVGPGGQAVGDQRWNIVFCTNAVSDLNLFYRGGSFNFPLYLYPTPEWANIGQRSLFTLDEYENETGRHPNFSPQFIKDVEARLGLAFIPDGTGDFKKTVGPEDIFHYMYAVFHSPTYRARYAEFLKIDFPRLPLTRNLELFRALAAKGQELVSLHLLEAKSLNHPITKFTGKGDNVVAKGYPKYEDETVWVNDEQGFAGVPEAVWEFHIGGYQVCHKWLKDRRGRELSAEDRTHYAKVVVALNETIRLMAEIDAAIPGWPME